MNKKIILAGGTGYLGKTLAKYLFEEIEKPRPRNRIERIVGSNPTHHSCLISILDLSVEKKYVFGAILFYLGKKYLEFALKGGDPPD